MDTPAEYLEKNLQNNNNIILPGDFDRNINEHIDNTGFDFVNTMNALWLNQIVVFSAHKQGNNLDHIDNSQDVTLKGQF